MTPLRRLYKNIKRVVENCAASHFDKYLLPILDSKFVSQIKSSLFTSQNRVALPEGWRVNYFPWAFRLIRVKRRILDMPTSHAAEAVNPEG